MPACRHTPLQIFVCDEESHFYSQVLEKLLLRNCRDTRATVIEFGAGDGTPVINALLRGASAGCNFGDSTVHGYELNPRAAAVASRNAAQMGVAHQYKASRSLPMRSERAARRRGAGCAGCMITIRCNICWAEVWPWRGVSSVCTAPCQHLAELYRTSVLVSWARGSLSWACGGVTVLVFIFHICIGCDACCCLGRYTTAASSRGQPAQMPRG